KEKRLALGVYCGPGENSKVDVTLKAARKAAGDARLKLADGIDPTEMRRHDKIKHRTSAENSFKAVALEWFVQESRHWSENHSTRNKWLLEKNLFPWLGHRPIAEITPPELLAILRKTESKGTIETAHRAKQVAGQVFRYAVATGRAERDPTPDLKGALA